MNTKRIILTGVREYGLIVRVVENIVPMTQRKFLQVGHFGFVDDVLKNITQPLIPPKKTYVAHPESGYYYHQTKQKEMTEHAASVPVETLRPG